MKIRKTKREIEAYLRWDKSNDYCLANVYVKCSYAKEEAEANIIGYLMPKYNGYNYRIIGHNSNTFSVGFIGEVDGERMFFYITAYQETATPLEYIAQYCLDNYT